MNILRTLPLRAPLLHFWLPMGGTLWGIPTGGGGCNRRHLQPHPVLFCTFFAARIFMTSLTTRYIT